MNDVGFFCAADVSEGAQARAELRLRVLCSLPPRHQRYLFEEIRRLCRDYLRCQRVPSSEMTAEELVSEIWQKLLGTVPVYSEETSRLSAPDPYRASIDADAPERDGRVVWLIDQIGGPEAMAHRHEDILRRRYGRALAGSGRCIVQPSSDREFSDIVSDADAPSMLETADHLHIWRGLLATASLAFQQNDDLSVLLRLLAENPGVLQESSGGQWPIKEMVAELNNRCPPPAWTADRVDNAKRRLMNWIKRLRRENGLDDVDLEALFARVARELERGGETSRDRLHDLRIPQKLIA